MEWKDKFNSFNSDKGYLWGNYYIAIKEWLNGTREKPLPPLEVSFDPIHACNLMCEHCNAHRYLVESKHRLSDKHILDLVRFLATWGVKTACFGGGGEPVLHTKLGEAIELAYSLGMESSLASNGTLLTPELINILVSCCRYVGISIDSATSKVYEIGRKADLFDKAITNISKLVEANKNNQLDCNIAYKFLIFNYNQHEIFEACKLAKKLGVRDFHVRPADFRHQGMGELKKRQNEYDVDLIQEEFKKCHEIEDDNFRVYTVVHKFNEDFTPKRKFSQCYAAPLAIQICADGNIYYCPDTRFLDYYKLGSHEKVENIASVWGGEKHKELVSRKACNNCNSRCTYSVYNEICERLFINNDDPMYKNFV